MHSQHFLRSRQWWLGLLVLCLMGWTQIGHAQIAPPFTILHSFSSKGPVGSAPMVSSLMQGKDGDLYGTTLTGGANEDGTVFKITTSGTLTTLYSFSGYPADGANPSAGLIQGKDGDLYGTTLKGGAYRFYGTVFKITTSGTLTTLYSFTDNSDGGFPYAGLIQGKDGDLYGTNTEIDPGEAGTVFKITTSGDLTTLHDFSYITGSDGAVPNGLIQGKDGDLYGSTVIGGQGSPGTVFKITTSGVLNTLHTFNGNDGSNPFASLIQDKNGTLYGTTVYGGATYSNTTDGSGTVFKISTSGDLATLYSFSALSSTGANTDGAYPEASLILGKDGALYGTTKGGGVHGTGTVFKITTAGALTTLFSFGAAPASSSYRDTDGAYPTSSMLQGKDGNLYGTTDLGGVNGDGTVFKLTMIPVIISFSPTSGPVGTSVTLKGVNFTEATAVKFGKIPASFTIHSDKSLTLTVPTGAVTGKISIVNPFGTGVSAKMFTVTP